MKDKAYLCFMGDDLKIVRVQRLIGFLNPELEEAPDLAFGSPSLLRWETYDANGEPAGIYPAEWELKDSLALAIYATNKVKHLTKEDPWCEQQAGNMLKLIYGAAKGPVAGDARTKAAGLIHCPSNEDYSCSSNEYKAAYSAYDCIWYALNVAFESEPHANAVAACTYAGEALRHVGKELHPNVFENYAMRIIRGNLRRFYASQNAKVKGAH